MNQKKQIKSAKSKLTAKRSGGIRGTVDDRMKDMTVEFRRPISTALRPATERNNDIITWGVTFVT